MRVSFPPGAGLRGLPGGILLVALLALGGCGGHLRHLRASAVPPQARVEGLQAFVQSENQCGPAALATVLTWAGAPATPEDLSPLIYLPGRAGTLPIDLSREVRARGLLAYRPPADTAALLGEVARGHPVLVLENRGLDTYPVWHYSVLSGYDLDRGVVVLVAGRAHPEEVAAATFSRTWNRGGSFALLALPPGTLPATADATGVLAALADLESVGKLQEAAQGYRAFLRRWPGDWRGAFGLGNALYRGGDAAGAEAALRRAHGSAPERPEPLNNLALLALERGRGAEASALARMALENAAALGLDPTPYRDTLDQVSPTAPR